VYSGVDPQYGPVAVKVFHLVAEDAAQQFRRELRILQRLRGLDSIVEVHRSGTTSKGEPYLVTQYLSGGSLQEAIERGAPMSWRRAGRYLVSVARAVESAHRAGVIHADLKPSNILLDDHDVPYVCDFGISRIVDGSQTITTRQLLTPNYAAPEVFDELPESAGTDIYALGATLAGLVAGRPPFQSTSKNSPAATMLRVMHDPPPTLTEFGAPVRLSQIVRRAMAKDSRDRFGTAGELAAAITDCLAHDRDGSDDVVPALDPRLPPSTPQEPDEAPAGGAPASRRRRYRWLAAVAVAAVAAAGGGAWFLTRPDPPGPRTVTVAVDGSGDFSTVEAALTELEPGSTIMLSPGLHETPDTIRPSGVITVIGAGADQTRLIGHGDGPVIEATGGSVTIQDMAVDYDGTTEDVDVIRLTDTTVHLTGLSVTGGTRHGIVVGGGSRGTIEHSLLGDNDGSGLVQGGSSDLDLVGVTGSDNLGSGFIWVDDATGEIRECVAERNEKDGFLVADDGSPELVNNSGTGNRESGFAWSDRAAGEARNNTSEQNSNHGFTIASEAAPSLIGNAASGNERSGFAWIEQSAGNGRDNQSSNNRHQGYLIADSAIPALESNTATGNGEAGFQWISSGSSSLVVNRAESNDQDGFAVGPDGGAIDLTGNESVGNGRHGFAWTGAISGAVIDNIARDNGSNGFDLRSDAGATLDGNQAISNESHGFVAPDTDPLATANTASDNGGSDWLSAADGPVSDDPARPEPAPDDPQPADEPAAEEPQPADEPAPDEPAAEEPQPADEPAGEEPPPAEEPAAA
jgi:tRNA A-37 threonylcarbamoyl transferase component Bud32